MLIYLKCLKHCKGFVPCCIGPSPDPSSQCSSSPLKIKFRSYQWAISLLVTPPLGALSKAMPVKQKIKKMGCQTKPQTIIPLPMTMFEGASEFMIHGSQFSLYQLGPHDNSSQSESSFLVSVLKGFIYSHHSSPVVCQLVEKNLSLNQYSAEHGTVTILYFSKSLLLQDLQVDPNISRMNAGSCSFDLLVHLGLFPGKPNKAQADKMPLDAVVSRGNCCCGNISYHGFVFLVSKYFQYMSVAETTTGGTCLILSTTIGIQNAIKLMTVPSSTLTVGPNLPT